MHELAYELGLVAGDEVADCAAHCVSVLICLGGFE